MEPWRSDCNGKACADVDAVFLDSGTFLVNYA